MTLPIAFGVLGLIAIIALLWCLRGFSRELKRGRKAVGFVVRLESAVSRSAATNDRARNAGSVIEIPGRSVLHSGRPA